MRNTKGFTVLEYVVALTLLSLVIIMVVTLFRSQGKYGRDTGKEIAVDEAVSMALLLIRQDITHAGLGVADTPKLAVFLGDDPGELFLSYGRFLDTNYENPDNVYAKSAYAKTTGSDISEDAFISDTGRYKYMQPGEIGAMLDYNVSSDTVSTHGVTKVTAATSGTFVPYPYTFTVSGSVSGKVAPAIVYKVWNPAITPSPFPSSCAAPPTSALVRNVDSAGCGRIILGGEPNFRVTSFRVRANFKGNVWAPDDVSFASQLPTNLRYLEVTIGYQIKRETLAEQTGTAAGWSRTFSKSIMVSPRTMMLTQY